MMVNVALIKLSQFITFALFVFMAMIYAGTFLLLPLDIFYQVLRGLQALGLPIVLALAAAGCVVAYVGYSLWKLSGLCRTIMEIGMELVRFGTQQVRRFDDLVVKVREADSGNAA
jgi:hypothetical protein